MEKSIRHQSSCVCSYNRNRTATDRCWPGPTQTVNGVHVSHPSEEIAPPILQNHSRCTRSFVTLFRRLTVNDYTLVVELLDSILNTLPVPTHQWERNVEDYWAKTTRKWFLLYIQSTSVILLEQGGCYIYHHAFNNQRPCVYMESDSFSGSVFPVYVSHPFRAGWLLYIPPCL